MDYINRPTAEIQPTSLVLFIVFLLSSIITVTDLSRTWLLVPIAVMAMFSIYIVWSEKSKLQIPAGILVSMVILYTIFIYHAVSDPGNIELVSRVIIFIPGSFILLFLIPFKINKKFLLYTISVIAGVVALLGIPSAFIGDTFPFVSIHRTMQMLGFELYVIESIMLNPNPLGELLFIGAISSLVWVQKPYLKTGLFLVCITGLFFAQSRAAFLGFVAAMTVYVVGSMASREQFTQFILVSLAAGTTGYLMLLRLVPGPAIIEQVYLSGRLDIWYAAIDAVKAQPVFGHGPGDMPTIVGAFASGSVGAGVYNSFLRLFVTTGVVGGLCYLYIFLYSIISHSKVIASRESLIVHALVIGFVVNELFSGNSIFGLSTTSVVGALLIGYLLRDIIENKRDTASTTA